MKKWLILLFTPLHIWGQTVTGVVSDTDGPVPGATVSVIGENTMTISSENGEFSILPSASSGTLKIESLGHRTQTIDFNKKDGKRLSIKLELDVLQLEQVVVTGSRTAVKKSDLPVSLSVLQRETFAKTGSNTLSDGLCFQPGLRVEIDCQTCSYSQLRMNGLGGAYSQLLIDSKPLFSAMAGLYGLEQLPETMIERVEVVRGSGSVLYGANAIGGTVNILTRQPTANQTQVTGQMALIGDALDQRYSALLSRNSSSSPFGWVGLVNYNHREAYDANGDGYSELPQVESFSGALNGFYSSGNWEAKLQLMGLWEDRRGGDQLDVAPEMANQSEWRDTKLGVASTDIYYTLSSSLQFQYFGGVQIIDREHYTGLEGSPGYGTTDDISISTGLQTNLSWNPFGETSGVTQSEWNLGYDLTYQDTRDEIPGYNYLVDQRTDLHGLFAQWSANVGSKWYWNLGWRTSFHPYVDHAIHTPRVSGMYKFNENQNLKASWGVGFRPPQAFDADLHIAFAGGGLSRIFLDPNLNEETSQTAQLSYEADFPSANNIWGFTVNGFFTQLYNPFIYEEIPDGNAGVSLLKTNGDLAEVAGVTLEGRMNIDRKWQLELGYTLQRNVYQTAPQWSETVEPINDFLRTPEQYGYYTFSGPIAYGVGFSLSATITGPMYVPHYGGAPEQTEDELFRSPWFFDQNIIFNKKWDLPQSFSIAIEGGIRNVFNQYQNDFDTGRFRDSNYIYGPARPRNVFLKVQLNR
ncbi:MAG: TonB-dependent receptor [Schleiferiaceae bacterium]